MAQAINRAKFLRGDFSHRSPVVRPPWAVTESRFVDACTRCDACLAACPQHILVRGDGGFPQLDFKRGECTFCQECVNACPEPVFQATTRLPWTATLLIADSCLAQHGVYCMTCRDQCDARAIQFKPQAGRMPQPHVDDNRCTGCGACIKPCPAQAIRLYTHTPTEPGLLSEERAS